MVFLGAAILSAFFGQATMAMFGDYYDGEWFIWLAVYGLAYSTFSIEAMRFDRELDSEQESFDDSEQENEFEDDEIHWDRPTRRWVPAETRQ